MAVRIPETFTTGEPVEQRRRRGIGTEEETQVEFTRQGTPRAARTTRRGRGATAQEPFEAIPASTESISADIDPTAPPAIPGTLQTPQVAALVAVGQVPQPATKKVAMEEDEPRQIDEPEDEFPPILPAELTPPPVDPILLAAYNFRALSEQASKSTKGLVLRGLTMRVPNEKYDRFLGARANLEAQKRAIENNVALADERLRRLWREESQRPDEMRSFVPDDCPPIPRPSEVAEQIAEHWMERLRDTFRAVISQFEAATKRRWLKTHPAASEVDANTPVGNYIRNIVHPPLKRYYELLSLADFRDMPVTDVELRQQIIYYWTETLKFELNERGPADSPNEQKILLYARDIHDRFAFGSKTPAQETGYYKIYEEWSKTKRPPRDTSRSKIVDAALVNLRQKVVDTAIAQHSRIPPIVATESALLKNFEDLAVKGVFLFRQLSVASDQDYIDFIVNFLSSKGGECSQLAFILYPVTTIGAGMSRDEAIDFYARSLGVEGGEMAKQLKKCMDEHSKPSLSAIETGQDKFALDRPFDRWSGDQLEAERARVAQLSEDISPDTKRREAQRLRALCDVNAKLSELAQRLDEIDYILAHTAVERDVPLAVNTRRPVALTYPLEVEVQPFTSRNIELLEAVAEKETTISWFHLPPRGNPVPLRVDRIPPYGAKRSSLTISGSQVQTGLYFATAVVGDDLNLSSVYATFNVESFCVRGHHWFLTGVARVHGECTWTPPPADEIEHLRRERFVQQAPIRPLPVYPMALQSAPKISDDDILVLGDRSRQEQVAYFSYRQILLRTTDEKSLLAKLFGPNPKWNTLDSTPVRAVADALIQPETTKELGADMLRFGEQLGANLDAFEGYYDDVFFYENFQSFSMGAVDDMEVLDMKGIRNERASAVYRVVSQLTPAQIISSSAWVEKEGSLRTAKEASELRSNFFVDRHALAEFDQRLRATKERYRAVMSVTEQARYSGLNQREIAIQALLASGDHNYPLTFSMEQWLLVRNNPEEIVRRSVGAWRGYHSEDDPYPTINQFLQTTSIPIPAPYLSERLYTGYDMTSFRTALATLMKKFNQTLSVRSLQEALTIYYSMVAISLLAPSSRQTPELTFEDVAELLPTVPPQEAEKVMRGLTRV